MRKIEMCDLRSQYFRLQSDIDAAIADVISSGQFVKGETVSRFESHLSEYQRCLYTISVANGTDALMIALMALDLQLGDEVIVPDFSFVATSEVVALLGLTPVFVDVDPVSMNISLQSLYGAVTKRTRAIIPVHLFGQNADMEPILRFASEHHIYVIEDACQSIGSEYVFSSGVVTRSGCMGTIGCTSFFPSKNLGCYGDGGAIFTNEESLANRIRMIANHGSAIRYHHEILGVNSRLDSIQAAVLDVKLPHLDDFIVSRQRVAQYYCRALSDIDSIVLPSVSAHTSHSFHQFTIRCVGVNRDELRNRLSQLHVPTMVYYPLPLHQQKAYDSSRYEDSDFPVSTMLSQEVLSLPIHTEMDDEQLEYIVSSIKKCI